MWEQLFKLLLSSIFAVGVVSAFLLLILAMGNILMWMIDHSDTTFMWLMVCAWIVLTFMFYVRA